MSDAHKLSRRKALSRLWQLSALTATGASGLIGFQFFSSRTVNGEFGKVIGVGKVKDFKPGSVTLFSSGHFFLVRAAEGGFLALHFKCTHLDCTVLWKSEETQFLCPCHGSQFSLGGEVKKAPAPAPLSRFPITITPDQQITVDTGTLIPRKQILPTDYLYAPEQKG